MLSVRFDLHGLGGSPGEPPDLRQLTSLVVWLAAALVSAQAMAAELPNFPQRTPYAIARTTLLSLGRGPVPSSTTCPPGMSECEIYPETLFCSGSGLARCAFRWNKAGTLIEVDTIREGERFVDRIRCRAGCR
jgi:hypothetical protein